MPSRLGRAAREHMDVRCERCKAEYKLDETRIPPAGASVRCSACGHVFRVSRPGEGAEGAVPARTAREWRLRRADGTVTSFKETSTLQRWIVEGTATREDELSPDGVTWRRLGDVPQLAASFARADELHVAPPREAAPTPVPGAVTPVPGAVTPVPGGVTPVPGETRRTLPYAGVADWGAPAAPQPPGPPEGGYPSEPSWPEPESAMEQTGRQFAIAPPEPPPAPAEEEEATRVYDTSRLPPLAMPPAEEEVGFQEEQGAEPWAGEPAAEPSAGVAGPAPWEEAEATFFESPEGEALPPEAAEPTDRTERLGARQGLPRWVVPAAAAAGLVGLGVVAFLAFWPAETPPARPGAPRPGAPGRAGAPGKAPALAGADAGTAGARVAAAPGARAAADAGVAPAPRDAGVAAAPAPRDAGVAAAPAAPDAGVAARREPAVAAAAPEAGKAAGAADAGTAAADREMFEKWLNFGDRRLKEGQSRNALRAYSRAAELDPASPEPHVRRGRALLGLENPKGAVTEFREALERDPREGAALFGLAEAYQALGNAGEARKAYQRYLQVLPRGPQAAEARARLAELESTQ